MLREHSTAYLARVLPELLRGTGQRAQVRGTGQTGDNVVDNAGRQVGDGNLVRARLHEYMRIAKRDCVPGQGHDFRYKLQGSVPSCICSLLSVILLEAGNIASVTHCNQLLEQPSVAHPDLDTSRFSKSRGMRYVQCKALRRTRASPATRAAFAKGVTEAKLSAHIKRRGSRARRGPGGCRCRTDRRRGTGATGISSCVDITPSQRKKRGSHRRGSHRRVCPRRGRGRCGSRAFRTRGSCS